MKIIVESGATKTDWCAIRDNGETKTLRTDGVNVAVMPAEDLDSTIQKAVTLLNPEKEYIKEMHFYVSGLIEPRCTGNVEYVSDLVGAARSVCLREPGIVAILGTGSNSCFYDGEKVVKNIRSGGYILGDEGSAAHLGIMFLSDFLKDAVPSEIAAAFANQFKADYFSIVKSVYKDEAPSRYLGSIAPWIIGWYDKDEYVNRIVEDNFRQFIERALCKYEIDKYPVGVVGGFGFAYRNILTKVAQPYGIRFSEVLETPMDGLIKYHSND